jgi:hypothetical protein
MSGAAAPVTFGPGSLESIRLERRRYNAKRDPENIQLQGRVRGTYRVYCGNGNEHTVTINGPWITVSWSLYPSWSDTEHDFTDADALARELIERVLEGWSDPCETGE